MWYVTSYGDQIKEAINLGVFVCGRLLAYCTTMHTSIVMYCSAIHALCLYVYTDTCSLVHLWKASWTVSYDHLPQMIPFLIAGHISSDVGHSNSIIVFYTFTVIILLWMILGWVPQLCSYLVISTCMYMSNRFIMITTVLLLCINSLIRRNLLTPTLWESYVQPESDQTDL